MAKKSAPTVKVKTPKCPNVLMIDADPPPNPPNHKVYVADLTDDQLKEVGRDWTAKLLEHAAKLRDARKKK